MADQRVQLPTSAFLHDTLDYEPLNFDLRSDSNGASAPSWVQVDADTGCIHVNLASALQTPVGMNVECSHAEGVSATASCCIIPEKEGGPKHWNESTAILAQRFNGSAFESRMRTALEEHFGLVYDYSTRTPRDCTLSEWLRVMTRLLRMLKSTACVNL